MIQSNNTDPYHVLTSADKPVLPVATCTWVSFLLHLLKWPNVWVDVWSRYNRPIIVHFNKCAHYEVKWLGLLWYFHDLHSVMLNRLLLIQRAWLLLFILLFQHGVEHHKRWIRIFFQMLYSWLQGFSFQGGIKVARTAFNLFALTRIWLIARLSVGGTCCWCVWDILCGYTWNFPVYQLLQPVNLHGLLLLDYFANL